LKDSIIILGSARSDGNTRQLIDEIKILTDSDFIDLNDLDIGYFDYEHKNQDDDFLPTAEKILSYKKIIFATPVYWYSMSAIMKTFFDRITDLVTIRKDLGRKLEGKLIYLISCSANPELDSSFIKPFSATADYLNMEFVTNAHFFQRGKIMPIHQKETIEHFVNKFKEL
jgi:multimeric flavodoxin WrbA